MPSHVVRHVLSAAFLTLAVLLASLPAYAQRGPGGTGYGGQTGPGGRPHVAGQFDYYVLALSWSPTHCASTDNRRESYDPQCDARSGRRFGFVVHGLWPQYDRGWPQDCPVRGGTFVPQPTIDRMLDIMPSRRLVIHQYRKHGSCSGLDPDGYFDVTRRLYDQIKIPPRFVNPNAGVTVSPGEISRDFLSVNPQLQPDMLAVTCGGPGNRLREVRICFSKGGEPRACGRNEEQRRLCTSDRVYLPPVRTGGPGERRPDFRSDRPPSRTEDERRGPPREGPPREEPPSSGKAIPPQTPPPGPGGRTF